MTTKNEKSGGRPNVGSYGSFTADRTGSGGPRTPTSATFRSSLLMHSSHSSHQQHTHAHGHPPSPGTPAGCPSPCRPGPSDCSGSASGCGGCGSGHGPIMAEDLLASVPPAPAALRSPSAGSVRRTSSYWLSLTDDHRSHEQRGRSEERRGLGLSHMHLHRQHKHSIEPGHTLMHPPAVLVTPQMRSQRLIGNSNPRYRWQQYFKSDSGLAKMKPAVRRYYERNNDLIRQYLYIDKLLDSSLPHNLIQEYHHLPHHAINVPPTISEEPQTTSDGSAGSAGPAGYIKSASASTSDADSGKENDVADDPAGAAPADQTGPTASLTTVPVQRVKRTPRNLYKLPSETQSLLAGPAAERGEAGLSDDSGGGGDEYEDDDDDSTSIAVDGWGDDVEATDRIVAIAIRMTMVANIILLIMKVAVAVMTSSVSVLASLVDAALDFLSTAIVWTTTALISRQDDYSYPAGRRRLEPIGVLVFSVIMTTSFFQVGIEAIGKLASDAREVVQLPAIAIAIMALTVVVKLGCWFWCRMINNSSVQALAQDAVTDVVFNIFSILFPLAGHFLDIWWLDPAGGLVLSAYVIVGWSSTSIEQIRNLSGAAATAEERNVLLYLTMRFARTIKQIQGLQAYHGGDKLIVEVDVVLDEAMTLRDSHDLGESLQYVLESVPMVDRAFVHLDYASWNLPTHMRQQE